MKTKLIFILALLLMAAAAHAQHGSLAYQKLADSLYRHHHYQHAVDYYEKALKKSKQPGEVMLQLAKCYDKINRLSEAEKWFMKAAANQAIFSDEDYYLFAEALIAERKKEKADSLLERVLQSNPNNNLARKALGDLRNFQKYFEDSARVRIAPLSINTSVAEFSPAYHKEGIVFSAAKQEGAMRKKYHWDNSHFLNLYYSTKKNDQSFTMPELFEKDLNTRHHDGPAAFYDNDRKMILNRNQSVQISGKDRVYEWRPALFDATFNVRKSTWDVSPLPFNESAYAFEHPSISEDGNTLYFSSDKPGGYGGNDIYRVERSNGVWGIPFNLGPTVNTLEDEAFPYFVNNTLYFASTGHGGLGGLDLFESSLTVNGFTPALNLGYPINSTGDDFSLITDSVKVDGYYASSRSGNDDLYTFHRLSAHVNIFAHIFDGETKAPLSGADIQVITNGGNDVSLKADTTGNFKFDLPAETSYVIIGTKDDMIGMVSDVADSTNKHHEIPAYRDTTRVACIGLIQDENGLPQNAKIISIVDQTTGQMINHPGDQSMITFLGERGHNYSIDAQHDLGNKAHHDLSIGKDEHGTKRFTLILPNTGIMNMAARVYRADDNLPLAQANVKVITFAEHDLELVSDNNGIVEFDLNRGTAYVVIASKAALSGMHSGLAEEGTDKASIIHPVPVYGDRENSVVAIGLVTSTSGKLVDGFKATVTNKITGTPLSIQTKTGLLTFLGDRSGEYKISVSHDNYETTLQELKIPAKGPDTEKFAVVLQEKQGSGKLIIPASIPLIAQNGKPSSLLVLDTDDGASKVFIAADDKVNEITEQDGNLYLQKKDGQQSLGKGTLSGLKENPSSILPVEGFGNISQVKLRNIYFEFDKYNLDDEDKQQLEQVKKILQQSPDYTLTVFAHADDRGVENYNYRLSKRRSSSVRNYLIDVGIEKKRIVQKAMGESQPVVSCITGNCSEEDHQKNRRAEFVLSREKGDEPPLKSTAPESVSTGKEFDALLENFGEKHVDGLSFRINIGAYRKNNNVTFPALAGLGKIESVTKEGVTYYSIGEFQTLKEAETIRQQVVQNGIQGASITIYQNGERIRLAQFAALVE